MAAAKTAGDLKDPNQVWLVFKSVFKNLMLAKGSETTQILNKVSQMITSFPQILVGSNTWPDSKKELAVKRKAFIAALVRRLVHVVGGKGVKVKPECCLLVMEAVFTTMIERNPRRYEFYLYLDINLIY